MIAQDNYLVCSVLHVEQGHPNLLVWGSLQKTGTILGAKAGLITIHIFPSFFSRSSVPFYHFPIFFPSDYPHFSFPLLLFYLATVDLKGGLYIYR